MGIARARLPEGHRATSAHRVYGKWISVLVYDRRDFIDALARLPAASGTGGV